MDGGEQRDQAHAQQQRAVSRVADDVDLPITSMVEASRVSLASTTDVESLVTAAFAAHRDEIFRFVLRSTRDSAEAEDVVQEVFLRLAREAGAGRAPDQLRAWLYRVATNLTTSRFRRRRVARNWLDRLSAGRQEPETAASPEERLIGQERFAQMERALETISRDARAALLLAAQGFSGREIAQTLGRSEVATRALMCRARLRVRAELESTD